MSNRQVSIAVDAMGGENSPFKVLKGSEIFLNYNKDSKIIFFGKKKLINEIINSYNIYLNNYEIIDCIDRVQDDDTPNTILRSRKESSIFKGLNFIKNKENCGFVSAGNTAALMILSRLNIGMINGIDRPAICSLIPNKNNFSIMLDLGANVAVTSSNLFQFAIMGFSYFSILNKNKNPKIGILNIGTEDNKGFEFLQDASKLIKNSFLNKYFIGFIEPNQITTGSCDIIISDGYTGNIMLKSSEGISNFITSNLRNIFNKSLKNKIIYKLLENDLIELKDKVNPEKYNGASLIGLNGIVVKSHGGASPYAFSCALERCYNFAQNNLNKKIKNSINNL